MDRIGSSPAGIKRPREEPAAPVETGRSGRASTSGRHASAGVPTSRPPQAGEASTSRAQPPRATGPLTRSQAQSSVFGADEMRLLNASKKVLVLEYSSTGGGHTERSLLPIKQALDEGKLEKGSTVVLLAPPRWKHDENGSKVNKLHDYADLLRGPDYNMNVIVKQSDKSVTGHYVKETGSSDNVAMLRDFIYKPRLKAEPQPLSDKRATGNVEFGTGHSSKDVLADVINAMGEGRKGDITVLGDMAPFLQKAARAHDIDNRVEIGNHQGLFDRNGLGAALGDKDLAYLHKASSGLKPGEKLSLVGYSDSVNVVPKLETHLRALGIDQNTTKKEAHEKAVNHLLACAKEIPPGEHSAGILVHEDAKTDPAKVKNMVYLYVNEYTKEMVDHIRAEMDKPGEDNPYKNTLFAVCGGGAIDKQAAAARPGATPDAVADDILQVMYAGGADGMTNAGFGTTSEHFYLSKRGGSEATLIVAPVVNQHEQEANAAYLVAQLEGKAVNAQGGPEMTAALDNLVDGRKNRVHSETETTAHLLAAAQLPTSGASHAAELLSPDGVSTPEETAILNAMAEYEETQAPKEHRRLLKLVVPMLDSYLSNDLRKPPVANAGPDQVSIQATGKQQAETLPLSEAKDLLKGVSEGDAAKIREFNQKMGLGDGPELHETTQQLARELHAMVSGVTGANSAYQALETLSQKMVALGW